MWWWVAVAVASELHVTTPAPMEVRLDGLPLPYTAGATEVTVAGLDPGPHRVEVRGARGRGAALELEVPPDVRMRLRLADGRLVLVETLPLEDDVVPGGAVVVQGVGYASGRVWIDGAPAPWLPDEGGYGGAGLAAGAHALRVEEHGRSRFAGEVEVRDGMTRRCRPELERGGWALACDWERGVVAPPAGAFDPPPAPPAPVEAAVPEPIDDRELAELRSHIARAGFASERIAALKRAAVHHWFTVAQLGTLLELLTFSTDRLEAVRTLQPRVLDPENAHALAARFPFSTDREAVLALFTAPEATP